MTSPWLRPALTKCTHSTRLTARDIWVHQLFVSSRLGGAMPIRAIWLLVTCSALDNQDRAVCASDT